MTETAVLIAHTGARMALSRKTFAQAAKVTLRAYQNYEKDRRTIPSDTVVTLSAQFGINIEWLLLGKDPDRQQSFEDVLQDWVKAKKTTLSNEKRALITQTWAEEIAKGKEPTKHDIHTWLLLATQ